MNSEVLQRLLPIDAEVPPQLRAHLTKLSSDHPSGISLAQLETPMMKQFAAAKEQVPDALIFFRMGDFFELFGVDALIAADICNLTLTSRDKNSDNPVPMAGVPVVTYLNALRKCIEAGFKVAICDQVEDPKLTKSLVRREIVRIATPAVPGDLGDESPENLGCYLAAASESSGQWTLCFVDTATGDFRITNGLDNIALINEVLTVSPKELFVPARRRGFVEEQIRAASARHHFRIHTIPSWIFQSEETCIRLVEGVFGKEKSKEFALGQMPHAFETVAAVLNYLKETQKEVARNIREIKPYDLQNTLLLDESTKRHLEFFVTSLGERRGSFFWFVNRVMTAPGARLLMRRMSYPFRRETDIRESLENVNTLVNSGGGAVDLLRQELARCHDLDRLVGRAAGSSLDVAGYLRIRDTLQCLPRILASLQEQRCTTLAEQLRVETCSKADLLLNELTRTFVEAAAPLGKGRTFREGFSKELDEVVALQENLDDVLAALEAREREKSQISTLKIGYNRVFGYYFEVSKGKVASVPDYFMRKQTLTNGERYITPELKELEEKALRAQEDRSRLETAYLERMRHTLLEYSDCLVKVSSWIASVDLTANFAVLSLQYGWTKPEIRDDRTLTLRSSVHPVLKELAGVQHEFVANDLHFSELTPILLITGPNMAGKSTIMRQVALTQILFQMGCFVPAASAALSVCDRIFSRIGSADHATKNRSTFMVEMLEVAHMLQHATPRSLLLMDEIGRGTSTYDGLAIAWAILEDLEQRLRAKVMFSTHYHELVDLVEKAKGILPMQMEVVDIEDTAHSRQIHFTHRLLPGAAGKSYGVHVAKLAGLSSSVISRAEQVLHELQSRHVEPAAPLRPAPKLKRKAAESGVSIFDFS